MPRKKKLKHHQAVGLKGWLMVGVLFLTVVLLLVLAKLNTPQDIRQKAAGSECYLVIKDDASKDPELVEGAGGKQQIGGVAYCVGGVGNDADRYVSFYDSKIAGQTDLKDGVYPCKDKVIAGYEIGQECQVGNELGHVICVGGPDEQYLGCIGGEGQEKFYERLVTEKVSSTPAVVTLTPSPTSVVVNTWQDLPVTVEIEFQPIPALDPTKPEKNQWPWLALFINNGQDYYGAFDKAACVVDYQRDEVSQLASCGQPNQYQDRLVDNFEVALKNEDEDTVVKSWTLPANKLLAPVNLSGSVYATKLSLVYYNDYWDGDKANRGVKIKVIRFLTPDGQLLKQYQAQDKSFWTEKGYHWNLKHSFYFDLGWVNDQGDKDQFQDGFVNAFDKVELRDILNDQFILDGSWFLDNEGSFNLVTLELKPLIVKYFKASYGTHSQKFASHSAVKAHSQGS